MNSVVEVMARGLLSTTSVHDRPDLAKAYEGQAQAALTALQEAGYAVVPQIPTPGMCEAGLFANNDELLMSASGSDMFEAYRAMLAATPK